VVVGYRQNSFHQGLNSGGNRSVPTLSRRSSHILAGAIKWNRRSPVRSSFAVHTCSSSDQSSGQRRALIGQSHAARGFVDDPVDLSSNRNDAQKMQT
jgi:hypothetical protein